MRRYRARHCALSVLSFGALTCSLAAEVQVKIHTGDDLRTLKGNKLICIQFDFDAVEWTLNTPHPAYISDVDAGALEAANIVGGHVMPVQTPTRAAAAASRVAPPTTPGAPPTVPVVGIVSSMAVSAGAVLHQRPTSPLLSPRGNNNNSNSNSNSNNSMPSSQSLSGPSFGSILAAAKRSPPVSPRIAPRK